MEEESKNLLDQVSKWTKFHARSLAGLALLFCGIIFVIRSREIISYLVGFGVGLLLIYFGLKLLGATTIIKLIDQKIEQLKRAFSR